MVKVLYKNGKKSLLIDDRVYGPYGLYYYITRTISTYLYFCSTGKWDDSRKREVKNYIIRHIEIYKKYFPNEAGRNFPY